MTPGLDELVGLLARRESEQSFTGIYAEQCLEDGNDRRWRVWRLGRLARIEDPPGSCSLIAGHRTYWRKWPTDSAVTVFPRFPEYDDFELSALTMVAPHDYWRQWLSQDTATVLSSLHQVSHEGRRAWRFQAPIVKGAVPTLTVDAELGLVLRAERADVGVFRSWSQVRTDVALSDDLFRYSGAWQFDRDFAYPPGWLPE